jgi:hypothetical protein
MLQIALLIAGIFVAIRLPKTKKLTPNDYPNVDPELFQAWHSMEIKSSIAFLIATWGVLVVQRVIMTISAVAVLSGIPDVVNIIAGVFCFALFVGVLIWAAILGSKAAKLKKTAGITDK